MSYRYSNREIIINDDEAYRVLMRDRGIRLIRQFNTAAFTFPTLPQLSSLKMISHTWVRGDRLYKLANTYYGDVHAWWGIAWFNRKPTDAHFKFGDVLDIPFPLEKVLAYFEGV